MSGSRVRNRTMQGIPGVVVLLVLAGGLSFGAAAQDSEEAAAGQPDSLGAPTLLVPRDNTGLAPDRAAGLAVPDETDLNQSRRGIEGIEVNSLGEIDPDSIGILGLESGGFAPDMWRGSSQKAVERLLPRLPGKMSSAAMRSLALRLLLTSATPPRRRGASADKPGGRMLWQRVSLLARMGEVEGLNGLLKVVPQRLDDEPLARARVRGLLLAGDARGACEQVRSQIADHHDKTYWRKALVFCQIHAGEGDQALLGVGLLREQGLSDDPAFFSLVDAYTGAQLTQVAVASPLHLAMLVAVGQPYPADLAETASPGILVALARSPSAEGDQRARAGERAVALGALEPKVLARIYGDLEFEQAERDTVESAPHELGGTRGRALLYQAARDHTAPGARAEFIRVALEDAGHDGLYQMAVQVFLPLLTKVPARPDLIWFAETAGRALYAAGRYQEAGAWIMLARQEAIINPQAAAAVTALWPYSRLAGTPALAWGGDLETWRAVRADDSADEKDRLALLRSAFMALGEDHAMNWIDLVPEPDSSTQPMPDAALLYALDHASEMRRLGETVLLSLLVLGAAGPAECHPMALNAVLRALREVGLERDARALAIEAAIAKGI